MAMRRRQEKWKGIAQDWATTAENWRKAYAAECTVADNYKLLWEQAKAELRIEWASRGR